MNISEGIAAIALLVSLYSLYRTLQTQSFNRALLAKEKRSEGLLALMDAHIEGNRTLQMVRSVLQDPTGRIVIPKDLPNIESQLVHTQNGVATGIEWFRNSTSDDPIQMEQYRSSALQLKLITERAAQMIRELPVEPDPWGA